MANIYDLLEQINSAIYGEDVRGSIHDAIEQCYKDATGNPDSLSALLEKLFNGSIAGIGDIVDGTTEWGTEVSDITPNTTTQLNSVHLDTGTWLLFYNVLFTSAANDSADPYEVWCTISTVNSSSGIPINYSTSLNTDPSDLGTSYSGFFAATVTEDETYYLYTRHSGLLAASAKSNLIAIRVKSDSDGEETSLAEQVAQNTAELIDIRTGDDEVTYADAGTAVRSQFADVKAEINDIESIQITYQSSQLTGSGSVVNDKRMLLNVEAPFASGIKLGLLKLVANDSSISATVTVELTHKNQDGSYTVYDSVSKSVNISGLSRGDLVSMLNVDKTTSGETYVFVSISGSTYPRVKMASVTGKTLRLCDSTSGTTFTTRDTSGYEMLYLLQCGVTDEYINSNNDSIRVLKNAVGDYEYHEFYNASQSSGYWNCYIYKTIPTGTKVRVTLLNNTSNLKFNVRAYDSSNNNQLIQGAFKDIGGTCEATLTLNAVHLRLQAPISSTITNAKIAVVVTTDTPPGLVSDLFDSSVPKVYHVEKDGSGDFTNLAKAIDVATQWMDSIVYVGAGTWNILDELGQDYLDNISGTQQGIVLKNRVHVICSSKAYIKCLYNGSDADVINYLSAFNAGKYGFTLENADIEVANVRYCVHDERNAETDHYDNYYINCRMKNTNQTAGSRSQCIGGGLGYDGHVIIDGCTFENPLRENYGVVSYHNAHGAATDSRSLIEVKGSYFYGKNTFRAGYYGNTTAITQCLVHGNSMGAEPYMTQEDQSFSNVNMEIVAWNNEIRDA